MHTPRLRLQNEVSVELLYLQGTCAVDCRLLFMGDHNRLLLRAYEEVVRRFERSKTQDQLVHDLESSAEILQFYQLQRTDKGTSVLLHDHIFQEQGPIEAVSLELLIKSSQSQIRFPIPLDRLCALGNLLPRLQNGETEQEILERIRPGLSPEQFQWCIDLLEQLKDHQFLTIARALPNSFQKRGRFPKATFMGHSSVLFQSERTSVLVDPILRMNLGLRKNAFDVARMKPGAICCTHSHWDHCDLQTLLWFDKDIPVFIPAIRKPTAFNPPMKEALSLLGFTDVREVHHWQSYQIEDIEFVPVPFHGEQDEPGAEIDHYTFVLSSAGKAMYGGVDCFEDTFGQMKPVLEKIREKYKPVLAFLPVSKMMYRYSTGGVNGFCRYFDSSLLDRSFQYTASADDAADWMKTLQSKWVAPYATFTFSPWSTPAEVRHFADALRKVRIASSLFPLRALDSIELSNEKNFLSAQLRRIVLLSWFQLGARTSKFDRRLQSSKTYGLFRKALKHLATHPSTG